MTVCLQQIEAMDSGGSGNKQVCSRNGDPFLSTGRCEAVCRCPDCLRRLNAVKSLSDATELGPFVFTARSVP